MNWSEIGTQVILSITGAIISGLGLFITYLINKHIKNDEMKQIMLSLHEIVKDAVLEVQQTYVDELKCKNLFDENAHKQALEKCLVTIKANMPTRVEEWLKSNYTDIEGYLRTQIEAQIKLLEIGGKK